MTARRAPLVALGGLLACYLLVPVVAFLLRVARQPRGAGFSNPGLFEALGVSALTATISLGIVTLLGLPLAYLLARSRSRLAGLLGVLVQLPLALPPVMSGILLVYLVGPYTGIGELFGGRLTESLAGIVLAQSFVASPFLVVTARSAFRAIDPALTDLATTLGRREPWRFATVAVPIALDGIAAGMLLCWLRAFGEYGATVILAYHPYSLPVFTYVQFGGTGLALTSAPTLLALAVAAVVLGAANSRRRRRRVRPVAPAAASAAGKGPQPPAIPAAPARPARRLDLSLAARLGDFELTLTAAAPSGRLALVGPSGSGKSATLRSIAGLLPQAAGAVLLGGEDLAALPPERRAIGYVAQGLALFPHLDVARQVRFGRGADDRLGQWWLARLGIGDLLDRRPDELSGGQRQRVRLAQALACSPGLLLLDEPLSALDVPVRAGLREQLRELQRSTAVSTVLVTHDPAEAALLADDVVVLAAGRVLQAGPRREVFDRPASAEVAALLGWVNLLRGRVVAPGVVALCAAAAPVAAAQSGRHPRSSPDGRAGEVRLSVPTGGCCAGEEVTVGVAPGGAWLAGDGSAAPQAGRLQGIVEDVLEIGASAEVVATLRPGLVLRAASAGAVPGRLWQAGDRCSVELDPSACRVWPSPDSPGAEPGAGAVPDALGAQGGPLSAADA